MPFEDYSFVRSSIDERKKKGHVDECLPFVEIKAHMQMSRVYARKVPHADGDLPQHFPLNMYRYTHTHMHTRIHA